MKCHEFKYQMKLINKLYNMIRRYTHNIHHNCNSNSNNRILYTSHRINKILLSQHVKDSGILLVTLHVMMLLYFNYKKTTAHN